MFSRLLGCCCHIYSVLSSFNASIRTFINISFSLISCFSLLFSAFNVSISFFSFPISSFLVYVGLLGEYIVQTHPELPLSMLTFCWFCWSCLVFVPLTFSQKAPGDLSLHKWLKIILSEFWFFYSQSWCISI